MATDPTTQPVHYNKLVDDGAFFNGRIRMRPRTSWLVPSIQWKDREVGLVRCVMGKAASETKSDMFQSAVLLIIIGNILTMALLSIGLICFKQISCI